jgi:Protein of unknown function (DUF3667)
MDLSPIDPNEKTAAEEPRELCSNCSKKMAKKGSFCPHCGQKRFEGRIPLKSLTKKFLYKVTNLDSQLLRMSWRLWIPARVSLDYFAGKIKQYPHPFQFFFVVMFFFLLVFNKVTNNGIEGFHISMSDEQGGTPTNQAKKMEQVKNDPSLDFYAQIERAVLMGQIMRAYDSLPPRLQTPAVHESLKIILDQTHKRWASQVDSTFGEQLAKDSLHMNLVNRTVKIAYTDVVEYTPDELTARYEIKDWLGKILIRQGLRSVKNPQELITACIGSFTWTILALVIAMAGVMYLFYWPQKRYYVEHFVVLLHLHSGVLLALTILMGLDHFFPLGDLWGFVGLGIFVFTWLTMKRFYGQNWFWTSLKWFGFFLVYGIGFAVFFLLGILVVFAVF